MSRKRPRDFELNVRSGPKPKRQFTEQDKKRATIYEELSDDKHEVRLRAAKRLLEQFSPDSNPTFEGFDYALDRLIRGLSSGRKAARAGYFVALTELIRRCSASESSFNQTIKGVPVLMKKVHESTKPDPDSKQEVRDKAIGRVSAYKSVLESSMLSDKSLANNGDRSYFIDQICIQAKKLPWLREECGSMLCDHVRTTSKLSSPDLDLVQEILDQYTKHDLLKTPEGVAIWLTISEALPELKLPKDVWHKRDPLQSQERPNLARVLYGAKEETENEGLVKTKDAVWKPRPNFAWHIVLRAGFRAFPAVAKFRQFWLEIIDSNLFANKASSERKLWGFQLFSWAVSAAPSELLPALFTPSFMRCLINQRSEQDRELFKAASQPLEKIVSRLDVDPDSASIMLESLLSSGAPVHFDRQTKSKTFETLVGGASSNAKIELVKVLFRLSKKPGVTLPVEAYKVRAILGQLFVSMSARRFKRKTDDANEPWAQVLVESLAELVFFTPATSAQDEAPPMTDDTRSMFHEKLIQSINNLLPRLSDPGDWIADLVQRIKSKAEESSSLQLVLKTDHEISKSISEAHGVCASLRKRLRKFAANQDAGKERQKSILKTLQILFSLILLEVYSGDPEAVEMLTELQLNYDSLDLKDVVAETFDHLLELLISFLSKSSSFWRQISELIFPVIAIGMSENGLASLLDILSKHEDAGGQGELFEAVDANGVDADEDDSDVSMDSDVEILSGSEDEDSNDKSKQNDVSSDEDDESEDNTDEKGEDPELEQFNYMLAQTLKTSAVKTDGMTNQDSSSDSDMDDDEMMALEPQLTKIFQERRKATGMGDGRKKKDATIAKLQMKVFKGRVLDLLQIYVKSDCTNPTALNIIVPLLELMRTTTSSELEQKARNVLQTWWDTCDRNKTYPMPDETENLWTLLREIHGEVLQEGSRHHDVTCSRASLFVVRDLVSQSANHVARLIQEYAKTQTRWIESSSNVQQSFFLDWCGWCFEWRKHHAKKSAPALDVEVHEEKKGQKGKKSKKSKTTNGH